MTQDERDAESWFKIKFNRYFKNAIESGNFTKTFPAIVKSVGNGVASITLIGDTTNIIPNVKLRAGVKVLTNDVVYVLSINRSMNNLIIDFNPSQIGATGSFTSADGKTITVVNGLITTIV